MAQRQTFRLTDRIVESSAAKIASISPTGGRVFKVLRRILTDRCRVPRNRRLTRAVSEGLVLPPVVLPPG